MVLLDWILDLLAWVCLGWYAIMVLLALSGSIIAFRKYRQPPPPPPFPLSSSSLSQIANPSTIRPNSKTQNLLIPSVSIIRPLCGLDYGLRENLESSFFQQWPLDRFEILFCVADQNDPAIKVVNQLISQYPAVHTRLLIGEDRVGVNPKINNLIEAYRTAKSDLLWILDSNARVHPTTLARAVSVLSPPNDSSFRRQSLTRIGLVHHVPAAFLFSKSENNQLKKNQRRFGCLLEACFLNGNHARQYLALNALGLASCLMGKSNLFYRSDLERATSRLLARKRGERPDTMSRGERDEQASLLTPGPSSRAPQSSSFDALEFFGQYLAEDNMIGQTLWDNGVRHAMTIDIVGNVVGPLSIAGYFSRRIRWIRVRKYMLKSATIAEPFTESLLLGILMTISLQRLDLTLGFDKKVVMMMHVMMYFLIDYSVYRSILHSPLISTSPFNRTYYNPVTPKPPQGSRSSSSDSASESSSLSSPTQDEELVQIKLGFFEFLIGWMARESLALIIWIVAISSNRVQWRKDGKTYKVLGDSKVLEIN